MNAPTRLGLYGLGLVLVFALAAVTANAVVSEETVRDWVAEGEHAEHDGSQDSGGHGDHAAASTDALGLSLEQDGFRLALLSSPATAGQDGALSFHLLDPEGHPVTEYEAQHEKELHLIVVRADGQHFAHVHPDRADDGTWSIPWSWTTGGTFRVFADTVPAGAEPVTVSTTVQVAGAFTPVPPTAASTVEVDGFTVTVEGDLIAATSSALTLTVTRDGEPVTTLQPYLGAYGHLVALREGDLAYLHAHPHGETPAPGTTSGPEITFEVSAPTPGRYLLHLDFQVDDVVHTAPLVIDAKGGDHDH